MLGDDAVIVDRVEKDGQAISAKSVRRLLSEGKFDEAVKLVPIGCRAIFSMLVRSKYGN